MAGEFFPRREAELRVWALQLANRLVAHAEDYGIPPERAAHVAQLVAEYDQAFRRATEPATATRSATAAKRAAKAKMIAALRKINGQLKALVPVIDGAASAGNLIDFGLNPRGRGGRQTLLPRPDTAPVIQIERVAGRTAHVRLCDAGSDRRGRPRGVKGANIYRFVGANPPNSISEWKFVKDTVRTRVELEFPGDLPPGAQVWITAQWKNPRCETGPFSTPMHFKLSGGIMGSRITRGLARAR